MNSHRLIAQLSMVLLLLPMTVIASGGHGHDSIAQDHVDAMHHQDGGKIDLHSGHDIPGGNGDVNAGGMIVVGSMVSKGIKGTAQIKNVSVAMADMGVTPTHHFMMSFVDEATGNKIEGGSVALKITNPDAKISEPIEMIGMDGHFGVDIILDMEGEYHFRLGTKLEDGTKRKYHFHYVNR